MNVLNPRRLALDLRDGRLRDSDYLRYLLASMVLSTLAGHAGLLSHRLTAVFVAYLAAKLAISVGGLVACSRANAAGDGRDFLPRLMCLALPLALWIGLGHFAAFYGSYALLSLVQGGRVAQEMFASGVLSLVLESLALGLYFALLCRFMRVAASA